jgi:hypothetical protein
MHPTKRTKKSMTTTLSLESLFERMGFGPNIHSLQCRPKDRITSFSRRNITKPWVFLGPCHRAEEADVQLDYFEKLTTEPETYYLAKKPCTLCFGKWPCIMKKGAPKCRVCDGEACSFYDPKAVQTEPESSKSKTTSQKTDHKKIKPTKPSSSKATSSKRQLSELSELSELSYVDPSPVKPQKKKMSRINLTTAREVVVIDVENEESDEEQVSHKPTKPTEPPSSRVIPSKRQVPELPELPYVDSSPV